MPQHLPRGPVMADIQGHTLTEDEKQRLLHPAIGGVILFRRNYQNPQQLTRLTAQIKALRTPALIIATDHEGGRVQRFTEGFTRLPAMRTLGTIWDEQSPAEAQRCAQNVGYVLATELAACGIDLSFTPVLDLDWGKCPVIGNRSFHHNPDTVAALALALQRGLAQGGMKTCGKHFPGHGCVEGDSHHTLPQDPRSIAELQTDIRPFAALAAEGMAAVMPAHVAYPQADPLPAGYSPYWLKTILRDTLHFDGVIFSDDLTMEGAAAAGGIKARARAAFAAGCDIVLVCNHPDLTDELLENFQAPANPRLAERWQNTACTLTPEAARAAMRQPGFRAAQTLTAALASPADTAGGVKVGEAF